MFEYPNPSHSNSLAPPTSPGKRKILVIDDSLLLRKLLVDELSGDHFEVYEAEDGPTGLAKAAEINPDLILLDYIMPNMDGYEVYKALREQPQFESTPVIVMSGRHDEVVEKFGHPFGKYDFLPKQASRDQLCDRINTVLPLTMNSTETDTASPSVNVSVQDIAAFMTHLGELESRLKNREIEPPLLPPSKSSQNPFFGQFPVILMTAALTATGIFSFYGFSSSITEARNSSDKIALASAIPKPRAKNIAALGRLEPQGEIARLSAPNSLEGSRIEQILIKEGDLVKASQVVAILDSQSSRLATLQQSESNILKAQAQLAKVQAGAKSGDISAQKANVLRLNAELSGGIATQEAEIGRIEADLRNAEIEYRRYKKLNQSGAVSRSELDTRQLRLETTQKQLSQAQASLNRLVSTVQAQKNEALSTLTSIKEIRPVDLQVARAEVDSAKMAAKKARADLALTYIRAPFDGTVLKVNVRLGEVVGSEGIISLGRTDQMNVVSEIYETDITHIQKGQGAIISSNAFLGQLTGKVKLIGQQVKKQAILDVNPLANTDFRVVEVKIELDPESSRKVSGLSNLQVQVIIKTTPS
jgi:HlyD family secretion protein